MSEYFTGYQCSSCRAEYGPTEVDYLCPKDHGNLDVILDYDRIQRTSAPQHIFTATEPSIWRYLPLLPLAEPGGLGTPFRSVGWTPVYSLDRLSNQLGMRHLWIKDESRNPTASFKDRASAVVLARARQTGVKVVVTASTGNAGAALAGMAAATGQKAVIFAPRTAPPAKIAQLLVYGADVLLVDGSYDDAFDLTIQAAQEFGWYCRNTGYNPFTAEGKKTAAFEIWEWMINERPDRATPLSVFVSVGDGNIISGIHKGFKDLLELGWLERMPRLFGVQAEGSAAIANAYSAGSESIQPVHSKTLADSISVDLPRDGVRAVRAARQTEGSYITVTDSEIIQAIASLGKAGVFAEPAGATSYAGLVKARQSGLIQAEDAVVVINTGNGLKDVKAAMQAVSAAPVIEPRLEEVIKVLKLKPSRSE